MNFLLFLKGFGRSTILRDCGTPVFIYEKKVHQGQRRINILLDKN